jgi:hypothetical protein
MKMMVILAVLCAALLLVTGVAFATNACSYFSCYDVTCYTVNGNNLTNSNNSFTGQYWFVCSLPNGPPTPFVCVNNVLSWKLSDFPEGLNEQTILYDGVGGGGYITFHGTEFPAFNGILFNGTDRYKIHGVEVDCLP